MKIHKHRKDSKHCLECIENRGKFWKHKRKKNTNNNENIKETIMSYTWINSTKECNKCEFRKDEKCMFNGHIRYLSTKTKIRNKCVVKQNKQKEV